MLLGAYKWYKIIIIVILVAQWNARFFTSADFFRIEDLSKSIFPKR